MFYKFEEMKNSQTSEKSCTYLKRCMTIYSFSVYIHAHIWLIFVHSNLEDELGRNYNLLLSIFIIII